MKRVFEYDFQGRKIVVEHGELAKQAGGAVLVRYDDTVILSTCVMSNNVSTADFFPLTILYQEKSYSSRKGREGLRGKVCKADEYQDGRCAPVYVSTFRR